MSFSGYPAFRTLFAPFSEVGRTSRGLSCPSKAFTSYFPAVLER
jgi:hypothetical protein